MSSPKGDTEIELYAVLAVVLIVGCFAALFVYLACSGQSC